MAGEISQDVTDQITDALFAGRKIEAIKLYRAATGHGLATAKEFVEEVESRLRAESPEKFTTASHPPFARSLLVILVIAILGAVVLLMRVVLP